ncbi:MAG TPA: hypothetical protein VIM14_14365, partial [Polyangia bacterium]
STNRVLRRQHAADRIHHGSRGKSVAGSGPKATAVKTVRPEELADSGYCSVCGSGTWTRAVLYRGRTICARCYCKLVAAGKARPRAFSASSACARGPNKTKVSGDFG